MALAGIFVLRSDAEYLFDELTGKALPLVIALGAVRDGVARPAGRATRRGAHASSSIGAVACIVVGWGVAQWPYILPESLEVDDAAAPSATLGALLVAAVGAVLIVLPGFIALYVLDQKSLLPDEGVD